MRLLSSKRRIVLAAAVLLGLFLLRPGASRLKSRITRSISSAVGRPVDVASVHLRLLPRPGFDLENLVVYDDPAFGAEPMLRAGEVTAALRLTSLLRGRLEIARLDLSEPSLNLVLAENGRWNLETLLEHAAHTPLAPTAKNKIEARPGFPYIEATSARINFKSGAEKKPYALTNADFSVWQDSENSWGVRLKAQPFRTDLNLNDTGLLQLTGTWQRSDAVRDTPLHLTLEWNRPQLGQFTKFFTGSDQGWRGEILLDLNLTGTPAELQITSNASIQDFRRYDLTSGNPLRLAAHCDAEYRSLTSSFQQIICSAPVGSGLITLKGKAGLPGSHYYRLLLTAEHVPASAAAKLAQKAKSNLPEDLVASGTVHGSLRIEQTAEGGSQPQFQGQGEIAGFRLASATDKTEIASATIPFLLTSGHSSVDGAWHGQAIRTGSTATAFPEIPRLEFGPFPVAIGRAVHPMAKGWINRAGYNLSLVGDADIPKALRAARMLGLPALQAAAEGSAQIDLQIAGLWVRRADGTASGFSAPHVTGTAKLRNLSIALRPAGDPIEIASADMLLLPDEVRIGRLNANAAGTSWTGSLVMPRGCGTPDACRVHFMLNANQIVLGELREWVSPGREEPPWYRVLGANAKSGTSFLASVRASGQLTANRLQIKRLQATRVFAKVSLDTGKLQISELTADFLGGKHRGEWQADFNVKPSVCMGSGSVSGVSLADVADTMKDGWIDGIASAKYEVQGLCMADFWSSADGTLQFDMTGGTLPHLFLTDNGDPLRVTKFLGKARLHAGEIEIKNAKMNSPDANFEVNGTATLKGELDFKLAGVANTTATAGYTITGTLESPRVNPAISSETQARLKAEAPK